jgi:hypothetical protein
LETEVIARKKQKPQFSIALPCEPENFTDFISSLLGKPQTLSKAYSGSFEIKHNDIESVYNLVSQRVNQQNQASLIQFTIRLVFDDNSTVLLNSLEDFKSYTEVRPLIATQTHLSWSFLVKFQDREHPEKQEIEMSFVTKGVGGIAIFDSEDSPIIPISRLIGGGHISFRVSHTARTWGADIESLLSGQIKHILLPESKVREFTRKHSGKISMALSITFFVCSIIACFYSAGKISQEQISLLKPLLDDPAQVGQKLNMLLELMASGFWGKFFFSVFVFTIFSLFTAILLAVWVETTADTKQPSYILLTKKSEQYKEKADKKYNNKWRSFIASIIVGVSTGIVGNIIFTTYWTISP